VAEELRKAIIEKIIIGTIAVVLSTFILHGYNYYQKEFEGVRTKINSVSSFAIDAKNEILETASQLAAFIRQQDFLFPRDDSNAQIDQDSTVFRKPSLEIKLKVLEDLAKIDKDAAILRPNFPKAAMSATKLKDQLFTATYHNIENWNFEQKDLSALETNAAEKESQLLTNFDRELAGVLSVEFGSAYASVYAFVVSPTILALVVVGAAVVFVAFFGSDGPNKRKRGRRSTSDTRRSA
jgi:hypothetical protein